MSGLVPGIHVLRCLSQKDVDGRDKPGHDEKGDSVDQPGMQNDAGADLGERNAEHQGDEVFVHGESPFAVCTISPLARNVSYLTLDCHAYWSSA
jgi:hypothetical protein